MLDRDLKRIAVQLSISLPDDKDQSRRVCRHLSDLVEDWLFEDGQNHILSDDLDGESSNNVARFRGRAAGSSL
jgi:hypothetical protein